MKTQTQQNSFLLIDGAQLALAELPVPLPDQERIWLSHVYDDTAAAVSPLLIDIEAASNAGAVDQMTGLVNTVRPQLHTSLIDTTLSQQALTQHLRRFIMIRTIDGKAFTLRFADCSVLPILATVFTPAQWAALAGPMTRWCVHGFEGMLPPLPAADLTLPPAPTPLVLSNEQLATLREATAPSMMVAHLHDMVHGEALPGSPAEQRRWAGKSRLVWRDAGNADDIVLRWLTSAALSTRGQILQDARLPALLGIVDPGAIRDGLQTLVGECLQRTQDAPAREKN